MSAWLALWPRAMSESSALQQLLFAIMCMVLATMLGSEDSNAQSCCQPLTNCSTRENWTCPPLTAAPKKVGPALCVGSTEELILLAGDHRITSSEVMGLGKLALLSQGQGAMPPLPLDPHHLVKA